MGGGPAEAAGSLEEQLTALTRGVVDLHQREDLERLLRAKKRLRVKAGFDPTRPDLHLGHTVVMEKLRQFQAWGHEVVFLVGDFTAMVGDPTGKNEARPRLTAEEVQAAAATYTHQAFKILDRAETSVRFNSEWLGALGAPDIVSLGAKYTVARMLERDDFARRYADGRPIHIHEFLYPLLQGYDSVTLACDVEVGGTDQLFNLMVGRDLMPRYETPPQVVMTMPLLVGTDARVVDGDVTGQKMSKSNDNYIGIDEPPFEMLQKLMLVDDQVLWHYMELLSHRSAAEIDAVREETTGSPEGIVAAKEAFAREVVVRFHDETAFDEALARRRRVSAGGVPDDVEETTLDADAEGGRLGLAKALRLAGLTASTGEAFRLLKQGGVYLDGARVQDEKTHLVRGQRVLVRLGSKKKRFRYLTVR